VQEFVVHCLGWDIDYAADNDIADLAFSVASDDGNDPF